MRTSLPSRGSWSRLGPILRHFGGHLGSQICAPVHAGVCLVKHHVLDADKLPRRVLDRSWPILAAKSAENDPNLAPQDDPKSSKNRLQKMIKILIVFKTAIGPSVPKFWALKTTQNRPKSHPKRVKNEDDFQERKSCSSRASWSRLGPILGRWDLPNRALDLGGARFC